MGQPLADLSVARSFHANAAAAGRARSGIGSGGTGHRYSGISETLTRVKLMYCAHCQDIVRLFPEKRTCRCGKSWGHYLEDNSTTVQTWPGLSLGIANPDFVQAESAFGADPGTFSPLMTMRCWINPAGDPDVKFVAGIPMQADDPDLGEAIGTAGGPLRDLATGVGASAMDDTE